jgi:hypothetical protein
MREIMGHGEISSSETRGLSFGIAELFLVGAWSEALGLRMVVRLDHGSETEEYEEVLVFQTETGRHCQYIMWRDAHAVFVQPLIGRPQCYQSVIDAIIALTPHQDFVVTDVMAPHWPDRRRTDVR